MRMIICAAVLSALAVAPAVSGENAKTTATSAEAGRTVYICDNSAMTRRAFAREFGKTEFVKADAAAAKGERWTAPKCMTAREARRLKQLASLN